MNSKILSLTKMKCMWLPIQIKKRGAGIADKEEVIKDWSRQLFDINTYIKLLWKKMEMLIAKIQLDWVDVISKHKIQKHWNNKETTFILSKLKKKMIPHFYINWKI